MELQGRLRRRRRRNPVGDAGRGRELPSCAGAVEERSFFLSCRTDPAHQDQHGSEAAATDRRHSRRQKAAGNGGGLLPPDAQRLAGGAAVPGQARSSIRGDHRPVQAGLRQPHTVPASAGVQPRRRRGAADAAERAWHPAQSEAGARTLQWFAGYPGVQSLGRSGRDVRAEDHADTCARARRITCIFPASTGACGTKKPSSHRRTSSCAKR